jgi:glycogen phosphorylase
MNAPDPARDLRSRVEHHLHDTCVVLPSEAQARHWYTALAHSVRDLLVDRWHRTRRAVVEEDAKVVHYLSAEFLLGRALSQNLQSLELWEAARALFAENGHDLQEILEQERDPGLGNGGLGRLAACFLDSMATLGLPGIGQGIRYQYGIFEQRIRDGQQVEVGDDWLRYGNVWEICRPEERVEVCFYGHVEHGADDEGHFQARWVGARRVWGVPYDMPIAGYGTPHVGTLRLWSAEPAEAFDLAVFNAGDYRQAVAEKTLVEAISKVLYPADHTPEGRELRLKQQVFFCTCAVADALRRFDAHHDDLRRLPEKVSLQLNDTHPAITVAELMRVLVDERDLPWAQAWDLTRATVSYTNHTLMPEALERWPVSMFGHLLPRHLEIITEIDRRFRGEVMEKWPGEIDRVRRTAILSEGHHGEIHMAHLATVGSHAVNGVAELHSKLVRTRLLPDLAALYPDRFQNKTNGVTPRRWMLTANPGLARLLNARLGRGWARDLGRLEQLEQHVDEPGFLEEVRAVKVENKARLVDMVRDRTGVRLDPEALFDVQIKRIHEYKRQLLAGLYALTRWQRLQDGEDLPTRAVLFGGKAAPGYVMAKRHIHFLHDLSAAIARDPACEGRLQVVFVPNYNVSVAEVMIPGADLSEQISTAGKEASGTGNMKLALNGALTIGTYDGANIEIRDAVGAENFFLFGHTADEVEALKSRGYAPRAFIQQSPRLARALDGVEQGLVSPDEPRRYADIVQDLRNRDTWLVCADYAAYERAQDEVDAAWADQEDWTRRAVLNIARCARFSSDRTISEYARDIWDLKPVPLS